MINRQKHNWTCGHVALANAYKWLGGKASYEEAVEFVESNKRGSKGSWPYELKRSLDKLRIPYRVELGMTKKALESELKAGNAVIYCYSWSSPKERGAHYVFIDKATEKQFRVWNHSKNGGPWIKKEKFSQHIKHTSNYRPEIYYISFVIEPLEEK